MKTLYVIGNGFDLHHGINSSYANFRDWLSENYNDVYQQMVETFGACEDNEWWNEFEHHLSDVDIRENAIDIAREHYPDFSSDEFRDRDWHESEFAAELKFNEIINNIRKTFAEWVKSLNAPDENKKIPMDRNNSFCINFNYTHTLEDLYTFEPAVVLHIHGDKDDNYESLVLGHDETDEKLEQRAEPPALKRSAHMTDEEWLDYQSEEGDNFVLQRTLSAVVSAVSSLKKDTAGVIRNNKKIFESMADVENVCIYGMSFSSIDMPYLIEIAKVINHDTTKWTISYYSQEDKTKVEAFTNFHLNVENVTTLKLDEL